MTNYFTVTLNSREGAKAGVFLSSDEVTPTKHGIAVNRDRERSAREQRLFLITSLRGGYKARRGSLLLFWIATQIKNLLAMTIKRISIDRFRIKSGMTGVFAVTLNLIQGLSIWL